MHVAPERGRRAFDPLVALNAAKEVFWRYGYEGASLTDLTTAMGINKPSLYAAFGSKQELFEKVIQAYAADDMAYARAAMEQPTAYEVAAALLHDNAIAVTRPDCPPGCLSIQGGISTGPANASVTEFLATSRLAGEALLADRFRRAVDTGDLPRDTDPAALARFLMIVTEGQAIHATAGVSRADLQASASLALLVFRSLSGAS
ncbi:TetR/AcrR family transcriptional regulator [Winogradskya consettensis]|uniref:TetR family transcriptional regulator n=1 Tax=Winogradskya consettensis TaxID=113560 RepID=A0A919VL89_9ACTN|nr:TetR/AcrR family transcriptional regulator [Actinoplanes consettensis]GIM67429.1 TetR family transcriptional regulator [Actinoplanes consettensis]